MPAISAAATLASAPETSTASSRPTADRSLLRLDKDMYPPCCSLRAHGRSAAGRLRSRLPVPLYQVCVGFNRDPGGSGQAEGASRLERGGVEPARGVETPACACDVSGQWRQMSRHMRLGPEERSCAFAALRHQRPHLAKTTPAVVSEPS